MVCLAADSLLAMVSLIPERGMSRKLAPGAGAAAVGAKAGAATAPAAASGAAPARSPLFSDPYSPEPWPVQMAHVRCQTIIFNLLCSQVCFPLLLLRQTTWSLFFIYEF